MFQGLGFRAVSAFMVRCPCVTRDPEVLSALYCSAPAVLKAPWSRGLRRGLGLGGNRQDKAQNSRARSSALPRAPRPTSVSAAGNVPHVRWAKPHLGRPSAASG